MLGESLERSFVDANSIILEKNSCKFAIRKLFGEFLARV
jgi:hypothetical protein